MRVVVSFDVDNAAYHPPNGDPIADTLCTVAAAVRQAEDLGPGDGGTVRDVNGNTVGTWAVKRR